MRNSTILALQALILAPLMASAQTSHDWQADAPGVRHHIRASQLPVAPAQTEPEAFKGTPAKIVSRPEGALPKVPDGFQVEVFASGFKQPRTIRVAPNGDIFLSESGAGRVLVFRAGSRAPAKAEVFAEDLHRANSARSPRT